MDTGESTEQPLTPLRRECRCFGFACSDYACVLSIFAHKAAGAVKHPAFPAPSRFSGDGSFAKPGRKRVAGMRSRAATLPLQGRVDSPKRRMRAFAHPTAADDGTLFDNQIRYLAGSTKASLGVVTALCDIRHGEG
jgi:hypothetical protein